MPRIHPGPEADHHRHGASSSCPESDRSLAAGTGFCTYCYEHGAFTLASGPSQLCLLHQLPLSEQPTGSFGIHAARARHRTPRGRAARRTTLSPSSGPGRPRRALPPGTRVRARGIARARARHRQGFTPHPGWRNFIDGEYRVLTSQREAFDYLARRVDGEDWRADKRRSWSAILHRLVCHMDWETGLITGLTSAQLAAAGARATRTVSRVLAWARDNGLLVVVEPGASAEFLGTDTGRTPTYALVSHQPAPPQLRPAASCISENGPAAGQTTVDESGDLPTSYVSSKPLTGGRRTQVAAARNWHPYDVPDTPGARNTATLTLLSHLGLGGRKGGKIEIWRARALLKPWWDTGATVAGLLHALEYHPDRPEHRRGDLSSGARDPLRIIGARLRPWRGRLGEIRAVQIGRMRASETTGTRNSPKPAVALDSTLLDRPAGRSARRAAQEALSEHLRRVREARGTPGRERTTATSVLPRRQRRPRTRR